MKVAIIGAGAAGLAAAYDLAGAGHQVTVYEAGAHVGGLASGFKERHWDWTLERFYHHWFQSDHDVLTLIDEIGARDKVLFPRPTTVIYFKGKFYPFDSMFTNMPQFVLTHFAPWDAVRFGLAGAYLKFSSNWKSLETVTADAWMRQWMGKRVYETLWKPLLVGKFGDDYSIGQIVPIRGAASADPQVPADAVTASGSGLDPHISIAYADLQVNRVAKARGVGADQIRQAVADHTDGRSLGFIGEPGVNVLQLNLELDQKYPAKS